MDSQIEKLTKKFLKDPVHVQVSRAASTADTIDQKLVKVGSKPEEFGAFIKSETGKYAKVIKAAKITPE